MVKERASFTLDKETLEILRALIQNGKYRNMSHVVENAIKSIADKENVNTSENAIKLISDKEKQDIKGKKSGKKRVEKEVLASD